MFMRTVYDERLAQAAYIIGCQATGDAIVIDPQRDVDRYIDLAAQHNLTITAAAETHIHADFVSGVRELAERTGAHAYLSAEGGPDWTPRWLGQRSDGGTYPHTLLKHNDTFRVGNIELRALHTPGHTPEHLSYMITDVGGGATEPIAIATGDFVFVGDLGRPDLLETAAGQAGAMQQSARDLYRSARAVAELPDYLQLWPGHGAGSACGKALGAIPTTTLGYEKRFNQPLQTALDNANNEQPFVDQILAGQPEPPLYFADMKRINRDGPPVLGPIMPPPRITADDLAALDPRQNAIADTRPWDQFRNGHRAGSLSLPLTSSFCTDAGSMIRQAEPVTIIAHEDDLQEVLRCLARIGRDNIHAWIDADELADLPKAVTETIEEITPHEAAARKAASPQTGILDVRRATEFAEAHAPDALNFSHTRIADHTDHIDPTTPWLVVCRSGARSARACSLLKRLGYNPTNVTGGMIAWQAAGQPTA